MVTTLYTTNLGATNYADKNVALRFYGLTVDEYDEVIPGARIKFSVSYYPDFAFSEEGFRVRRLVTRSDARGRFFISAQGVQITIERVTKKNFYFAEGWSTSSDQYLANGASFPEKLGPNSPARFVGKSTPES